jgi:hypothetical protein
VENNGVKSLFLTFQSVPGFRIALRLSGTRDLKGYDENAVPVPRNTPTRKGPEVPVSSDLFVQKAPATRYFSDEVKMKIPG